MSGPVDIGVVGLGTIARTHLEVLEARPEVRLAFVVEPDPAAQVSFRGEAPQRYQTLETALLHHDPDLIVITSPTATHLEVARTALTRSDAQVLVEKPLVHDLAALRQIRDLGDGIDLPSRLSVAHHFAFAPEVTWAARQMGENPGWGPPTRITAAFHDPYLSRGRQAVSSYVSSWIDSGANQLSMLARFVLLDDVEVTRHSDDGSRSWSAAVIPAGMARFLTSWEAADSSKRSIVEFGDAGVEIWLDHTAMTAFVTRGEAMLARLDDNGQLPRKVAHYTPLYESLLSDEPDPILAVNTAVRVVELLLSGPSTG